MKTKLSRNRLSQQIFFVPFFLATVFGLAGCGSRNGQEPASKAMEVGAVTIKTERVVLTKELPGRTAASLVADIRPQVNGLILKRVFEEGALVKAGELLYQIDPAPYQAAYEQAEAAVDMAKANLPALRSRAGRFKELAATHAVGQQDYDNALAAMRQAEAQLESSQAALEMAKINLSYTPIKSPIAGRIGRSSVTEGAMVTAYQPVPLATVQDLDPIFVDVPQSTSELLKLQRSMADGKFSADNKAQNNKVTIIYEDGETYPHEGMLEFRDVTVDPTTGSVILRITVPNPDSMLLPGMFVRAVVKEGVVEKAILLTQSGVCRNSKGEPYVWVIDQEGKSAMRMITTERALGDKWIISSGLAVGERVIVDGLQRMRPGIPVVAVEANSAGTK